MSEANWFHVFDSDNSLWLSDGDSWSRHYRDAAEFNTQEEAIAAAKAAAPKDCTAVVLGDFGNANDY